MIQAVFTRQSDRLETVTLTGHAGSGEYGFDIVCAAVSALSINCINSLEVLADCQAEVTINETDGGYMLLDISHLPQKKDKKVQLILESFLLGMTNLTENAQEFVSIQVITN